jgi:hypothetical protein
MRIQVYPRSHDSLPFGFSLVRSWIRGRAPERRAVVVAEPVEERAVTELGFEIVKGGRRGGPSTAKEEVESATVVDGAARQLGHCLGRKRQTGTDRAEGETEAAWRGRRPIT